MSVPDRPVLSVVLVVHQEQAHVDGCARSVLEHPGRDIELVVVDNASGGYVPGLLRALVESDERVVVERLDSPLEHGEARARGIRHARGRYLWFVDTVDRVEPGAVTRVVDTLVAREPDVLVVDYVVGGALATVPSARSELVRRLAGRKPVTVETRPELLDLAPATWSLVMRSDLLADHGISPAGARSEVAVGYGALLAAESVVAAPGVGYQRLVLRNAVRTPAIHGTDADLLAEFKRVYAFLDARPALAARRRLVTGRVARAGTQRLHRMPASGRRAFARELTAIVRAQSRPDDVLPPGRLTALRMRLLRGGHAALYRVLESVLRRGRSTATWSAKFWRTQRGRLARVVRGLRVVEYRLLRLVLPMRGDLAVFASYWYGSYACNPRAIYEKTRELAPHIRGVWVVERGVSVPEGVETVRAGSRRYFRLLARATYFVNNVNFPNHWQKRKGSVHLQTHHGTPLKKMGLDLKDAIGAGAQRTNFGLLLRRCARWDFSLSSNPLSTLVWERVYPVPFETLEYGYPRNDRFALSRPDDVVAARAELGIPEGSKALLYAPTHREYERSYRSLLDTVRLAESLGEEWVVLARAHYFYANEQAVGAVASRVVDVTGHPSIETLCLASDVLVTDYSSLMFDYAVLDRPIVIYAPDWDTYRLLRGTYFDLMAEPPGVVCQTQAEVADAISSGSYAGDVAAKARRAFRSRYCPWDDGRAAERVVRRLFLDERPESPAPTAAA